MLPEVRQQLHITDTTARKLEKLHLNTAWDLALHLPLRYEDETKIVPISAAPLGEVCQVEGEVLHQEVQFKPRKQLVAQIKGDDGAILNLRFIHFYPSHQKQLSPEQRVRALGEIKRGYERYEMIHPKIKSPEKQALATSLTPIYPTTNGLTQPVLRKAVQAALAQVDMHEILPARVLDDLRLPTLAESLRTLHYPPPHLSAGQLGSGALPEWQRLKFDELLAQQLSMRLARQRRQHGQAMPLSGDGRLCRALLGNLPFRLTAAQERVCGEIRADLAQSMPMHRLLQGDVGSGKTIVAALSALTALESAEDVQVAIMAPTEILAEQHFVKFRQWLEPLGLTVAWLSGSLKKKEKEQAKAALADGRIRVAVGTHALFQDDVVFRQLGLVIVDEQHRFGVAQRLALKNKGREVHQLMMSATPIPRTLAMSFYADLDVSSIDELPPNRTPIKTLLVNQVRRHDVEGFVLNTCQKGQQAYWVCPLIEESEALQLQTATDTLARLQAALPGLSVGLVHGRMKAVEKAAVMAEFIAGRLHVLVATTVIEVGVDVPNASLMVIEHAERFGLSQLHQLRGRVGRGSAASACVLLYEVPEGGRLGEVARERLKAMLETHDGFEIARRDLALRGPGEFLGERQSGAALLRFADLQQDEPLIEWARQAAPQMLARYPALAGQHVQRWLGARMDYLKA